MKNGGAVCPPRPPQGYFRNGESPDQGMMRVYLVPDSVAPAINPA